jgi:hypothetical protein
MAYRSDIEALETRLAALEADVADKARERDELAQMLAEARHAEWLAHQQSPETRARKRRRAITVLVAATLGLAVGAAAIYGAQRAHRDTFAEAYAMMSLFTEEMCVCRTGACVEEVSNQMTRWAQAMAREASSQRDTPDEAEVQQFAELGRRMSECMDRAMTTR